MSIGKLTRDIQIAAGENNIDLVIKLDQENNIPIEIKRHCVRIAVANKFDDIVLYFYNLGINLGLDSFKDLASKGNSKLFIQTFDRSYTSLLYDYTQEEVLCDLFIKLRNENSNDKNKIFKFLIEKDFKVESIHLDCFFISSIGGCNQERILSLLQKVNHKDIELYTKYVNMLTTEQRLSLMTYLL